MAAALVDALRSLVLACVSVYLALRMLNSLRGRIRIHDGAGAAAAQGRDDDNDEQRPLLVPGSSIVAHPSRYITLACLLLLLIKLSLFAIAVAASDANSIFLFVAWAIALVVYIPGSFPAQVSSVPHTIPMLLCFYSINLLSDLTVLYDSDEGHRMFPSFSAIITVALLLSTAYQHSHLDNQIEKQRDDGFKQASMVPPCRQSTASIVSLLLFSWMNPLMRLGDERPLTFADIPQLSCSETSKNATSAFQSDRLKSPVLLHVLLYAERWAFVFQTAAGLITAMLSLAGPLVLYEIIGYIKAPGDRTPRFAFGYVLTLGVLLMVKAIVDAHAWQSGRRMGIRLKAVLVDEIFRKSLRRAPNSTASTSKDTYVDATVGKIVTLVSADAEKVKDSFPKLQDLVVYPFRIILASAALFFVVGWPAFAALAVMLLMWPLIFYISHWQDRVFERLLSASDRRTDVINEALQGIRIIKCFAWESKFLQMIETARKRELRCLIDFYIQDAISSFIWLMSPVLVSFFTLFAITFCAGIELDAQMAFTCLSLFNTLRVPLSLMPDVIVEFMQIKVSVERIAKFLSEKELDKVEPTDAVAVGSSLAHISVANGLFKHYSAADALAADDPSSVSFCLRGIDLRFPIGRLSTICGPTASGKSSLLLALLGEMDQVTGSLVMPPRDPACIGIAYVSQQSWLQNATIRDNITFGEPYNPLRYDSVIKACALARDFASFESGDLTEIGEKGINLSGGQKQRISLARAAYSRASVILLDDPLSAVDAPTARSIFKKAILTLMEGRTRILVTHNTSLVLPESDYIVVLHEGVVIASGDIDDVSRNKEAADILDVEFVDDDGESSERMSSAGEAEELNCSTEMTLDYSNGRTREDARKLVEDESVQTGAVKLSVYLSFIGAAGGLLFALLLFLAMTGDRFIMVYGDYWVKIWAESYGNTEFETEVGWRWAKVWFWFWTEFDRTLSGRFLVLFYGPLSSIHPESRPMETGDIDVLYYISVYAAIGVLWILVFIIADVIKNVGSFLASKRYHDVLLQRIFGASLRFFDTTPTGRILNRITKDISVIDKNVMNSIEGFASRVLDALFVIIVVSFITPTFIVAVVPLALIYAAISGRYLKVSRAIKRIEAVTRSPLYSMLSETLYGVTTIRAYGQEQRFIVENLRRLDANHRAYFYLWSSNRWLSIRISAVASFVIVLSGFAVVIARDIVGPGLAAMSITWALNLTDSLLWIVRVQAEMEMHMNSVERVNEYLNIQQEKPAILPQTRPPGDWPSRGEIIISDLEMRYSPSQPPVLRSISVSIGAGEKIGICGRTGAGKTSLSLSFFRIVDPLSRGSITIDGIDISSIGLYDLRSRLTLVPQDPVLFSGTVRSNLDPFSEHDDASLWQSLDDVGLLKRGSSHQRVSTDQTLNAEDVPIIPETSDNPQVSLDSVVVESGANVSQGQRQLICLARALIKSSKVTIFDEATASVDHDTDFRIQQTLRGSKFSNTTIITIAHRLRTVADYDKILVLDRGEVKEYGTPYELFMREGGILRDMAEESGEYDDLLELASKGVSGSAAPVC